jgi:hypothetical protein
MGFRASNTTKRTVYKILTLYRQNVALLHWRYKKPPPAASSGVTVGVKSFGGRLFKLPALSCCIRTQLIVHAFSRAKTCGSSSGGLCSSNRRVSVFLLSYVHGHRFADLFHVFLLLTETALSDWELHRKDFSQARSVELSDLDIAHSPVNFRLSRRR